MIFPKDIQSDNLDKDNTFEYYGGLGKVLEEAFNSTLKQHLQIKRYNMKKMIVARKEKPKHIQNNH